MARIGATRRGSFPSPYEQVLRLDHISLHPDYIDNGFINDIAMLRLEKPVIFSDYVRPVCLPQSEPKSGTICTVTGWGQLFEIGRIFRKYDYLLNIFRLFIKIDGLIKCCFLYSGYSARGTTSCDFDGRVSKENIIHSIIQNYTRNALRWIERWWKRCLFGRQWWTFGLFGIRQQVHSSR